MCQLEPGFLHLIVLGYPSHQGRRAGSQHKRQKDGRAQRADRPAQDRGDSWIGLFDYQAKFKANENRINAWRLTSDSSGS